MDRREIAKHGKRCLVGERRERALAYLKPDEGGGGYLMAKCSGITQAGTACKGIAIDGSAWCYAHHPDHTAERRRHGSRGGKRGGRGRPGADVADLKQDVRTVIDDVLEGKVLQGPGAVALQGYNVLLRASKLELVVREQQD